MRKEQKFLICSHCGNLVSLIHDAGVPLLCCGEPMAVLTPNTTEAATEKHIPAVTVSGNTVSVQVGSVEHPMTEAHSIQWIYVATENGGQRKSLCPDQKPIAVFTLHEDKPLAVYAYCNLHGLWKVTL